MQSIIRFSLFGNFEKFSTSNLETYMKLITFFGQKGYKPSTANELILQANGQVKTLIMPTFLFDDGIAIEISTTRINFQKTVNEFCQLSKLNEVFESDLLDIMLEFIAEIGINANRVALNCNMDKICMNEGIPTISTYFDGKTMSESSVRNAIRNVVEMEESNIIFEKYVNTVGKTTKLNYDINSIAENRKMRFDKSNIKKMYTSYVNIGLEIEKGLNG